MSDNDDDESSSEEGEGSKEDSEESEEDYRDLEASAWEKYDAELEAVRSRLEESRTASRTRDDKTKTDSLAALVSSMVRWKDRVNRGDDDIPTKFWSEVMSSIDIMTDCGDTVSLEMEWYVETARKIVDEGSIFEMDEVEEDGESKSTRVP